MPTHSQFPSAETSRTHTYARAALQCGPIPFRNTHHLYTSEHARTRVGEENEADGTRAKE